MCKDGSIKIGDLNVSKVAREGLVSTQTGTPYYASPEVWKDKPYDSRSDIWSLGCVLYEMTALKPPFTAKDMKSLYLKVIKGFYSSIPRRYSIDLSDVISMCLQTVASSRPTAEKLINSEALQRHIHDVKDESIKVGIDSPKTNLLNTIKLPKKLLDITKRLPKANYCSPILTSKKKILDIKIAKGLPEIFEKPRSRLASGSSMNRNGSEV
jgi:NIMA (never in mitosis gene a)-related kinase